LSRSGARANFLAPPEPAASAFALDTGAGGIKPELACIRVHLVILCRRGNAEAALSSARNHG
jgi:hypothetical protein